MMKFLLVKTLIFLCCVSKNLSANSCEDLSISRRSFLRIAGTTSIALFMPGQIFAETDFLLHPLRNRLLSIFQGATIGKKDTILLPVETLYAAHEKAPDGNPYPKENFKTAGYELGLERLGTALHKILEIKMPDYLKTIFDLKWGFQKRIWEEIERQLPDKKGIYQLPGPIIVYVPSKNLTISFPYDLIINLTIKRKKKIVEAISLRRHAEEENVNNPLEISYFLFEEE